jgi:hypothetical protein
VKIVTFVSHHVAAKHVVPMVVVAPAVHAIAGLTVNQGSVSKRLALERNAAAMAVVVAVAAVQARTRVLGVSAYACPRAVERIAVPTAAVEAAVNAKPTKHVKQVSASVLNRQNW